MSMMGQADDPVSEVAEGTRGAGPQQLSMSPVQAGEPVDAAKKVAEPAPPPQPAEPMSVRLASARALAARIARRSRLAEQIRTEHPHYTKAEVDERLEQFGA
jgi:hypothetical protein